MLISGEYVVHGALHMKRRAFPTSEPDGRVAVRLAPGKGVNYRFA
jgi:hypothetical protein